MRATAGGTEVALPTIRDKDKDVIESGALKITWISGTLGGITAILTVFNEELVNLFGDDLADELKAGILVVVILAWSLIAVADLMARAKVTAARLGAGVTTAPRGMRVSVNETDGKDSGWEVSAIRGTELLIAKRDKKPKWVKQDEVTLD
jgi:hypothetical protein